MDNSKEYIKMCEKAKKHLPQELKYGDYVNVGEITDLITYEDAISPCELFACGFYLAGNEKLFTKLYRQDQLQEMVENVPVCEIQKWLEYSFCDENEYYIKRAKYNSYEKLWLAFVMKEKFNKTWNGNDWEAQG